MSRRRWVTVKEIHEVGPGSDPIHPGTYGLIHNVDDKGIYVCFPQCHNYFPFDKLQPIQTMPDVDDAIREIRGFRGHHCGEGEFQFKIKAYGWQFPELINKHLSDKEKYDKASEIASYELRCFVGEDADEGLMQLFPWIDQWHTAGRSGGWLVIRGGSNYDADTLEDRIVNIFPDDEENPDSVIETPELQAEYDQEADHIIDLAMSLRYIETIVKRAVTGYESWVSSEEPWEEEIAEIKERLADELEQESNRSDNREEYDHEQPAIAG